MGRTAHRRLERRDLRGIELLDREPSVSRLGHDDCALRAGIGARPEVERSVHHQAGAELVAPLAMQLRATQRELTQQLRPFVCSLITERRCREARNPAKLAGLRAQLERRLRIEQKAQTILERSRRGNAIGMARRDHAGRARRGAAPHLVTLEHNRVDAALSQHVGRTEPDGATTDHDNFSCSRKVVHAQQGTGVLRPAEMRLAMRSRAAWRPAATRPAAEHRRGTA